MDVPVLDWLVAGSTVALGLALIVAPVAVTPRLSSLYALHGALEGAPALSRLALSPWAPPLAAALPTAVAIYCTVTAMWPRQRRLVLLAALVVALGAAALFVRGVLTPIIAAAGDGW